jgi:hypothetical protein
MKDCMDVSSCFIIIRREYSFSYLEIELVYRERQVRYQTWGRRKRDSVIGCQTDWSLKRIVIVSDIWEETQESGWEPVLVQKFSLSLFRTIKMSRVTQTQYAECYNYNAQTEVDFYGVFLILFLCTHISLRHTKRDNRFLYEKQELLGKNFFPRASV